MPRQLIQNAGVAAATAALLLMAQSPAWAKKRVQSPKVAQSYSAVDVEEGSPHLTPTTASEDPPASSYAPAPVEDSPQIKTLSQMPRETVPGKKLATSFDSVPAEQVEPIANRLKVVEELLRKHGRAYDYRIHTLRELQGILSSLDSITSKKPADQLPPPPQVESPTVTPAENGTNSDDASVAL